MHQVIYAHEGERVTCENGHPICRFARDVEFAERFDLAALDDWTQPVPEVGGKVPVCAVCGAQFCAYGHPAHFPDGWRASRTIDTTTYTGSDGATVTFNIRSSWNPDEK